MIKKNFQEQFKKRWVLVFFFKFFGLKISSLLLLFFFLNSTGSIALLKIDVFRKGLGEDRTMRNLENTATDWIIKFQERIMSSKKFSVKCVLNT